jgi:hypothetical protein
MLRDKARGVLAGAEEELVSSATIVAGLRGGGAAVHLPKKGGS